MIRFPAQTTSSMRQEKADHEHQEAAKILKFPKSDAIERPSMDLQERGQVFAAHRIVTRVADQLDSIAAL